MHGETYSSVGKLHERRVIDLFNLLLCPVMPWSRCGERLLKRGSWFRLGDWAVDDSAVSSLSNPLWLRRWDQSSAVARQAQRYADTGHGGRHRCCLLMMTLIFVEVGRQGL